MVHEQGLHFSPHKVRNWIMPINRKYKLGLLLETLREELRFKHNCKVLFEYVMLAGINDRIVYCVGLNKDFKKMLSEHAEFKALSLKDIYTASDGTKKIRTLHYIENLLIDFERVIIPCDRGRTTVCVSGQVRPVVRGKGTAQSSNNPTGAYPALFSPVFCPSFTTNPYLVAHPAQHTTKPQTDSSISESIQAAPSPAPPVQKAPFPPKTQIFCPVSQTAAAWTVHPLSPLAKEFIPSHAVRGNFGKSQTTASIQPASRLTSPACTFGPVIPVGQLAQASNASVRPSSSTSKNQACQFQPSSNRSAYKTRQIRPSRRPQSPDLSDLHALAQATKDFPADHIKQEGSLIHTGSRWPHFPAKYFSHCFHTRCLEIVTPREKSADPPCDLGENAS
ncbi:hypothetical protein Pint_30411 [Pistacia integerrima]|uniref:Uncharacterized protein n=1 Tax=Pistacia integerrima TaxID=434235 RepID=A0ACC0X220_9ROSI|nr:hypothetical protein Pint_30411 [Pistacia integerrima]